MNMNADRIKEVITKLRQCDNDRNKIGVYTFEDAIEAIEQLRKERDDSRWWAKKAIDELIEERDEARREVCESEKYCKEEAKSRGWNCYKEETP